MAGLIGLFFWSPWASEGRAHEREWLSAVEDWRTAHRDSQAKQCLRAFADRVGAAPTDRMQPVAQSIRSWCRGSSWYGVSDALIDAHRATSSATFEADFSRSASSISGVKARVHCWPEEGLGAARGGRRGRRSRRVLGRRSRGPTHAHRPLTGCVRPPPPLRPGRFTPYLNTQSYELAEAIVTLAHEAEHLRTPAASEAVVECPRAPACPDTRPPEPAGGRGTRRRSPTWRGRSATRSSSPTTGRAHAGTAGRSTFARFERLAVTGQGTGRARLDGRGLLACLACRWQVQRGGTVHAARAAEWSAASGTSARGGGLGPAARARPDARGRRRADSNRCTRLCRPLPNHSATSPRRHRSPADYDGLELLDYVFGENCPVSRTPAQEQ